MYKPWNNVPENINKYQGFVYIITNTLTQKKYIGKKFFWKSIRRKPLKGQKRIRKCRVESDWKSYYGSSNSLNADILKYGTQFFDRTILRYCKDKWECSYYEMKEQIDREVLLSPDYYNGLIRVRLSKLGKYKQK